MLISLNTDFKDHLHLLAAPKTLSGSLSMFTASTPSTTASASLSLSSSLTPMSVVAPKATNPVHTGRFLVQTKRNGGLGLVRFGLFVAITEHHWFGLTCGRNKVWNCVRAMVSTEIYGFELFYSRKWDWLNTLPLELVWRRQNLTSAVSSFIKHDERANCKSHPLLLVIIAKKRHFINVIFLWIFGRRVTNLGGYFARIRFT